MITESIVQRCTNRAADILINLRRTPQSTADLLLLVQQAVLAGAKIGVEEAQNKIKQRAA